MTARVFDFPEIYCNFNTGTNTNYIYSPNGTNFDIIGARGDFDVYPSYLPYMVNAINVPFDDGILSLVSCSETSVYIYKYLPENPISSRNSTVLSMTPYKYALFDGNDFYYFASTTKFISVVNGTYSDISSGVSFPSNFSYPAKIGNNIYGSKNNIAYKLSQDFSSYETLYTFSRSSWEGIDFIEKDNLIYMIPFTLDKTTSSYSLASEYAQVYNPSSGTVESVGTIKGGYKMGYGKYYANDVGRVYDVVNGTSESVDTYSSLTRAIGNGNLLNKDYGDLRMCFVANGTSLKTLYTLPSGLYVFPS